MRQARPTFVAIALQLLGLWTLAVTQPILDLLQRSPEFFVAHGAGPFDIFAIVLALGLGAPLLLIVIIWGLGRVGGVYPLRTAIAVLASAITIQVVTRAGVSSAFIAIPPAFAVGAAAAFAHAHVAAARTFASVLSLAAIVVPVIFLARPSMRPLVFPSTQARSTGAVAPQKAHSSPPILMIIVDEISLTSLVDAEGKIDPVLYPTMAKLARDGVWFRNATAVADFTRWAVPSMLTGRYPRPELLPNVADHPDNLFTLLSRSHRMEAVESVTRLCPRDVCRQAVEPADTDLRAVARDVVIIYAHIVSPEDLRRRLPPLTSDWARFGAEQAQRRRRARRASEPRPDKHQIVVEFGNWISADDPQPTFYFLHTLLPHSPWEWLPTGQRNATRAPVPGDRTWSWTDDAWGVAQYYQRHLLQIGLVDRVLGQVIARLEAADLYEDAMVVVSSDHGISFHPGGPRRSFTEETAADIMRVPLLIKAPKRFAKTIPDAVIAGQHVVDRNVETIDIVPTIAHAAGIQLPWKSDGGSLLDPQAVARRSKRLYFASAQQLREYGPEGPPLDAAVRRKIDMFGGPENPYRVPRPARFGELVGRRLDEMRVEDGGGEVVVANLPDFDNINPRAGSMPFDVAGEMQSASERSPVFVAVAVNGIVRAVTRTWASEPRKWLATPPLDAWREGANDLQIFVVNTDSRGPLLRRMSVRNVDRP